MSTQDEYVEIVECWSCGGEGFYFDCLDGCCVYADEGCDACRYRCDVCDGAGGWPVDEEG